MHRALVEWEGVSRAPWDLARDEIFNPSRVESTLIGFSRDRAEVRPFRRDGHRSSTRDTVRARLRSLRGPTSIRYERGFSMFGREDTLATL